MKKKEEIAQLNKLLKKIKVNLKAFLQSENQEELHQFRVQVKKLKAVLTLYAYEKKNKNLLKYFKPIKEAFAKAGEIRNAHINLKLGEQYQLNETFHQQQQQLLNSSLADFKKNNNLYLKSIKKAKINLQTHTHRLHNKTIRKFYKDKVLTINQFFADPAFNEDLHTARKNIKLLIYNHTNAAAALQNKLQLNLKYLDELQDNIGEWHDHILTMKLLAATGNATDAAIANLKSTNENSENIILDLSSNFKDKVKS
ncbi:MAG: CHAD domain-containing protein, partial [Sphingobacteriaceae bacterium]